MVDFTCPKCRLVTSVPDYLLGQKTVCPECGARGVVEEIAEVKPPRPRKKRRREVEVDDELEDDSLPGPNVCGILSLVFMVLSLLFMLMPALLLIMQIRNLEAATCLAFLGAIFGLCGLRHHHVATAIIGAVMSTLIFAMSLLMLNEAQKRMRDVFTAALQSLAASESPPEPPALLAMVPRP